ncbi:MAG: FAD-dependent oxidoreductase [Dehalococcoidia bacterium]
MTELKNLFQPIKVGGLELKNRIVCLSVMTGYGADDMVTDRLKTYYAERARGGAALLITGIIMPSSLGRPVPGMTGIYHDRFIPGLRQLTDVVHAQGAKIAAQIGLQYNWAKGEGAATEEVAPSEVATRRGPAPRALTLAEIQQMVTEFSDGARRARDAGFDAVELHCGIGYMINRFLSPCTNKRSDEYGGNLENRMRFLLEIIEFSKRKAGADYPLICRISGDEFMEGGHTLEDCKKLASFLEKAGVHCLNIQAGWHESPRPLSHMSVPRGAFVYIAEEIKKVVAIPVVAAYRINDPILAEEILAQGRADLIGMARPLIADPELPHKAREGRFDDIRPCIACGHCLDSVLGGDPMECAVNARVGREAEYTIEPAKRPKKVFVIGGGPAGMEAAAVAAKRGHEVTLFEKEDRLGGNLLLASVPSYKWEIGNLTKYLETQLKKSGAEVRLGEEMSAKSIEEGNPEVVIIATGTSPSVPDLPGVTGNTVATAVEVLSGQKEVAGEVIVVGGEMVGCETADFLAEKGGKVTLLARRERVGDDIGRTTRWVVLGRLRQAGIRMETKVNVVEITDKGVRASREGAEEFFEGDSVVLAVGLKPDNELSQRLEGKVAALYSIGDCVEVQKITQAIEAGFRVAREI